MLLALVFASGSAAIAQGMTLEQIARLTQVGEIAPAPDGQHVAFTRSVPRDLGHEDDGPAWSELHVIGEDGSARGYVTGAVNVSNVGWLPDGSAVTFVAERDGDDAPSLYAIPIDGGEAIRLASVGAGVADYSVSPDGDAVALVAGQETPESMTAREEKGFDAIVFEEQWLPRQLWIQPLGDEQDDAPRLVQVDGSVQGVSWSPSGDRLALRVTPRQLVDDVLMFQRIQIIAPDGSLLGRVDNPGKLGEVAWSDGGRYLAFIGTEVIEDTRAGRLMVTGPNGGDWVHLMPGLAGHVVDIDWDGETIVFVSHEGVESRVGRIGPSGQGAETLLERDGLVVTTAEAAGDRLVARASSSEHPSEAFDISGDGPRRLTNSNAWLADVDLARQRVIEYEARDGLMIQGLLIEPLNHDEGRRYPLILAVHGGPESHYSNGWLTAYNLPAQHAAAEGYYMFYPNYRGSTGRGVEFALSSQGRPAQEEFDDLVDGVDYLVEQGWVDGERVGITGGSYGGYATAWGATYYSERFAAAVMNVGLSDKIAMVGTSDIPRELYEVHYLTWPWEDWSLYRKASPIYYADRAQTPILIMHGAADPRVDPTQSRILYRYLTLQDDPPPVRLVLYPGEGHGNRRAASRWDYSLRLMRWMNHYLKGEGGEPPSREVDYAPF